MTRRAFVALFIVAATLTAAAGTADAKPARRRGKYLGPSGTFQGVITKVSDKSVTIDAGSDKPKLMTFAVVGETSVTSGRDRGTVKDLKVGHIVTIRVKLGKAESIDATGRR